MKMPVVPPVLVTGLHLQHVHGLPLDIGNDEPLPALVAIFLVVDALGQWAPGLQGCTSSTAR